MEHGNSVPASQEAGIVASATSQFLPSGDAEIIANLLGLPSGRQEKMRKRWIEFDCQNGVHHGKYATYENGKRTRIAGGYIGRFNLVEAEGEYGKARVKDFINHGHNCHYPERFAKDIDECGVTGIEVKDWPSGRVIGGLADSRRTSGSDGRGGKSA